MIQPRDLTKLSNFKLIYKGAEFYEYNGEEEKNIQSDKWFNLFVINQKERKLTETEFTKFIKLSNILIWEEL